MSVSHRERARAPRRAVRPASASRTLSARSCRPIRPARSAQREPRADLALASRSARQEETGDIQAGETQQHPPSPRTGPRAAARVDAAELEWPCGAGVSSSRRGQKPLAALGRDLRETPARRMSSSSIALNHGCSPACACATVTSGLRRPSTCIQRMRRFKRSSNPGMACADIDAGIHSDGTSPTSMPRNAGAATPTTVIGCWLTRTLRPTTSGAPASCVLQKSYESTTTGLAPGVSSSSCREDPAQRRAHAEHGKVRARDDLRRRGLVLSARREIDGRRRAAEDAFEDLILQLKVAADRVRHQVAAAEPVRRPDLPSSRRAPGARARGPEARAGSPDRRASRSPWSRRCRARATARRSQ